MKKETLQRLQDLLHDARAKAKQSDRLEDWKRVSYLRKAVYNLKKTDYAEQTIS